ncbi:mitochondrial fission ELM1 family protein [Maricaulis salignorans]|uniref:mitochondrial fission ELM1 family protein n=1 Tax=Maricaulis salignorans TaxID=144026 RepID=UPI003A93D309
MSQTQSPPPSLICWVVSDGRRGIENQALGLAEAVQAQLAAAGTGMRIGRAVAHKDGSVALPDCGPPDLWIGCGRAAIKLAGRHRRTFTRCFFTYVQDPRTRYRDFDLILAPAHDRLTRPNALAMIGSPNRISATLLEDGRAGFAAQIEALAPPRAAVLIGGDSKRFRLTPRIADYLVKRLEGLLADNVSLMITASRRTPKALSDRLSQAFAGHPRVWLFDGEGENPYFAFLAAADWIFVTEESTNMLVEASATGKPVYALPMDGSAGKFTRLHAALEAHGAMRPWLGRLEKWSYTPLAETDRAAGLLINRWAPPLQSHAASGDAA